MSTGSRFDPMKLSDGDLELINSELGLRMLFANEQVDVERVLRQVRYELRLQELQAELIKMQSWIIKERERLVVIFEGRDSAGKGGAIRRITARINARHVRTVALPKPSPDQSEQWYFQRYVEQLPRPGEMVLFDRSWYNRAVVEPVNGFCTHKQYRTFLRQVNEFERMITESGIRLIKFYFSITKREQARRFEELQEDPRKRWKMTDVDRRAQELWTEYTRYKRRMFNLTNVPECPWIIIDANKKPEARIEAIERILAAVPYE